MTQWAMLKPTASAHRRKIDTSGWVRADNVIANKIRYVPRKSMVRRILIDASGHGGFLMQYGRADGKSPGHHRVRNLQFDSSQLNVNQTEITHYDVLALQKSVNGFDGQLA